MGKLAKANGAGVGVYGSILAVPNEIGWAEPSGGGSMVFFVAIWIAIVSFGLAFAVFAAYFFLVLRTDKVPDYLHQLELAAEEALNGEFPMISMLIPAHNEADVIGMKLRDVADMEYPRDRREIIVIDDASTDRTHAIAEQTLREFNLPGRVVACESRTGVNGCYNLGFKESKGAFIVTTDADVKVDHDALLKSMKIISRLSSVGGVTSRMKPISLGQTSAAKIEGPYRSFYDAMLVAESAIHSTFPGYTNFALVRRSAFPTMPLGYGSTDGNLSLAIVRQGLRYICVPSIVFYEPIVVGVREQLRQKTRRAARQIQAAAANLGILFNPKCGEFGALIFPLRLLMMVSSLFCLVGVVAVAVAVASVSALLLPAIPLLIIGLYLASKRSSKAGLLWSLIVHEFYLLMGLIYSPRRGSAWRSMERTSIAAATRP